MKHKDSLSAMSSFDFNFSLLIYSTTFPFTEDLFNVFQSKSMDILFCSREIKDIIEKLKDIRENKFHPLWKVVTEKCSLSTSKTGRSSLQPELSYRALFLEIIDTIVMQMKQRFESVKDVAFIELLDCKRFHLCNSITMLPERCFLNLKKSYSSRFNFARLRLELTVLYSQDQFRKNNVEELHQFTCKSQLYEGFKELYKLIVVVLTIPYSTSSVERSFSALKRIKTYLRNTQAKTDSPNYR